MDIISRYVPLEKKGKEYMGVCPFHADTNPSMHVSAEKQIYKCFACGAGGDVFRFVSKMENLNFPAAVVRVSEMVGAPLQVSLEKKVDPVTEQKKPLFETMNIWLEYCSYLLFSQDGQKALHYLHDRKFTDELIREFGIGYAPAARTGAAFLEARKLDPVLLKKTGLIQDEPGPIKPVFSERITIPIHDEHGQPVGITARCMPGSSQAKYINTRETELYSKGDIVFNYHRALPAARKAGRLILSEGAMDVLGLAKAGIREGVACLGTACTPRQLQLLQRANVPVTVFYDSDRAGRNAAFKFGQAALQAQIPFSIVSNSLAKDPDEIYCEKGAATLQKVVTQTISFAEFSFSFLREVYDLDNYEDRKKYAAQLHQIIQSSLSGPEQSFWLEKLKDETGIDYTGLQRRPQNERRQHGSSQKRPAFVPLEKITPGRIQDERTILLCMLYSYECTRKFREKIGFFADPVHQQLALYIYTAWKSGNVSQPADLIGMMEEDEPIALLTELLSSQPDYILEDSFESEFETSMLNIQEEMLNRQIEAINEQIRSTADIKEKIRLSGRKTRLIQERNELVGEQTDQRNRRRKEGKP